MNVMGLDAMILVFFNIYTKADLFNVKADFDIIEAEPLGTEVQALVIFYELFRGFSGAASIEK